MYTQAGKNTINLNRRGMGVVVIGFIVVLVLIILAFASVYTVPAGYVGVITRFDAVIGVANPGLGFKIPFVDQIVDMSVQTQKDEVDASAMSENLQVVTSKIAINYHLDGKKASAVYQNIGTDYPDVIVAPAVQNTFKAVTAQYTAEQLITNREELRAKAEEELTSRLAPYNIIVENFNIVNFDFSSEYQAAIEAKQVAEQQVQTSQQKLDQAKIDAETVVAQAQGQADAQAALKNTGSLTPEYLEYLFLTKWDGKLPSVMSGANPVFSLDNFLGNTSSSTSTSTSTQP
jgi:regulator of protease activity HflC (stomatin/prohibitin superfamily)